MVRVQTCPRIQINDEPISNMNSQNIRIFVGASSFIVHLCWHHRDWLGLGMAESDPQAADWLRGQGSLDDFRTDPAQRAGGALAHGDTPQARL